MSVADMRTLLVWMLLACASPRAPDVPNPPTTGACTNGALLGSKRVDCAPSRACVLADDGPKCVAHAELEEPCGMISCGAGCTCSGVGSHECVCPKLGAP